jgi:serine/threonine-protein kinase
MAVEPYIRQRWPHCLISWTRILRGGWRDPLVARDLLIGIGVGAGVALCVNSRTYFSFRSGLMPNDFLAGIDELSGPLHLLSSVLGEWVGLFVAFYLTFILVFLSVVCRRLWIAGGVFLLFWVGAALSGPFLPVAAVVSGLVMYTLFLLVIVRAGLLAAVSGSVINGLFLSYPFPADFSAWYAGQALLLFAGLAGLGIFAFYHSLGRCKVNKPA